MSRDSAVRVGLLLPDLMGTYGDSGNAIVLERRLAWRGIPAETVTVTGAAPVPESCDVYVIGGGEDAAQRVATAHLREHDGLQRAVTRGAVVLAVCAGLQVLGESYAGLEGEPFPGLGLLDVQTVPRLQRAVGELLARPRPPYGSGLLTGFENHQGATSLGPAASPLAEVVAGVGNGAGRGDEGVVQGRIVGTYLHGPVLARNPELADLLLAWVLGEPLAPVQLPAVDRLRSERVRAAGRGRTAGRGRVAAVRGAAG